MLKITINCAVVIILHKPKEIYFGAYKIYTKYDNNYQ